MAGKTKQIDRQAGYAQVFRALGDPHRLHILGMLREREMNAGELLNAVDVVQSTLSHHMKSLCEAGLVVARKAGKCTYYSVAEQKVEEAYRFLGAYLGQGEIPQVEEVKAAAKVSGKSQTKTTARKSGSEADRNKAMTATDVWGTAEPAAPEKPKQEEKASEMQKDPADGSESLYAVMKKNGKKKKDKKDKKSGKKDKKKNKK